MPRTLNDAKDKHFSLGKGPRGIIAEKQFYRAWNLLLEITGDITLTNIRREHGNEFVRRLVDTGVSAETIKRYLSQIRPVILTGLREFELNLKRSGSVDLNRFRGVSKWISALVTPPPSRASAGRSRPDRGVFRQAMNVVGGCCRSRDTGRSRRVPRTRWHIIRPAFPTRPEAFC